MSLYRRCLPIAGIVILGTLFGVGPGAAQMTVPERTGYGRTSSLAEVDAFLDSLQARGAGIHRGVLTTSTEGRRVPYVIAGRPLVIEPSLAHRSGKPVVYLQGNIHGGEVEGKEAIQMLLRDLTLGPLRPLLDSVILVITPVYNSDGNDAFGPASRNRRGQNGPDAVGLRPNGQGLDLNRDYIKQESPEARSSADLINRWDPDLLIDLHTTNGSYHGYVLTYAPGLNPNSPPANDYTRDHFLPTVRERMRSRHGWEVFPYGNFRNQNPDSLTQGWYTYDARPRFGTNWMGMRGRLSILSEAYSNADFETRIRGSYDFVLEILRLAVEEYGTIREVLLASDGWRPDSVVIQSTLASPIEQNVIAELTERDGNGTGGFARRRRTGVFKTIRMPVYDRFVGGSAEAMPTGYLLPPGERAIAEALRRQGIGVAAVTGPWSGRVERFRIDSLVASDFPFEGHRTVDVSGRWAEGDGRIDTGWYWVPTDQRLGVLAAYLLEPGSEDGYVTWNRFDRRLRPGRDAPVMRVRGAFLPPMTFLP